ncbi:MAG TPA: hypothetical protein VKB59_05450 [Micromonosporaceae bacterium]|nr:hypothetical protein [Micromonosporaceae bacterium]
MAPAATPHSPVGTIWRDGPAAFAFLTELGFSGPERIAGGLRYQRGQLQIDIDFWAWKNECGFDTTLRWIDQPASGVQLDRWYVDLGLGPAQDVPTDGGNGSVHLIRKRLEQHAEALRRVLPRLPPDTDGVAGTRNIAPTGT